MLKWHVCFPYKPALQSRPGPPSPEPSQLPCPLHLPHRAGQRGAVGEAVSRPPLPPPLPPCTGSTRPARPPAAALPTSSASAPTPRPRWQDQPSSGPLRRLGFPPRPTTGGLAPPHGRRVPASRRQHRPGRLRARPGRDQGPLLLPACLKRGEPIFPQEGGDARNAQRSPAAQRPRTESSGEEGLQPPSLSRRCPEQANPSRAKQQSLGQQRPEPPARTQR